MEIKEEKKNSKVKIVIFLLIIVALVAIVGFAYARYVTRLNGTTTADIAQWSFKVNGKTNENFVIDLATTRTGVTQEAEVQEGYIGPGTAGAFELVLDATGSDVSLEYDINLNVDYSNNEVFPKNLIFYTDSTMQNAIYHTDNNINLNGFIGWNDGSKVHTKTIYWKWEYETGSTQAEKDNNDIADSYWMGKPISLSMNVTAKQVNENPTTGQYSVTFDANGGTLQGYGNASTATKQVTYGEAYGTLLTPTREGYRFLGWNGKNILNFSEWADTVTSTYHGTSTIEGNSITISATGNDAYTNSRVYGIHVKPNTDYVVSWSSNNNNNGTVYAFLNGYWTGDNIFYGSNLIKKSFTLRTKADTTFITFRLGVEEAGNSITYSNIQIEEGSTATPYEPYYITSSTEVVQNHNHTLTAIWKPNS